jgi:putative ABC transport system substrate-binding protein
MRRRDSLAALLVLAGFMLPRSYAQQSAKPIRIGFLSSESAQAWAPRVEALRAGLRDLGYVEHRNLVIEYRWAEGKAERLPALAAELVASRPAVIVAGAAPASCAAKQATSTIPIVMVAVGDAVEFGLVPNLPRPGGNITGSTFFNLELTAKRVELLKEALPRLRRAAFLLNPESVGSELLFRAYMKAADALKLTLQKFEVARAEDFVRAFAAIAKERFEAVAIPG